MSKYEDNKTLYSSKINSDLTNKKQNKMKKADEHSMRLDENNPNHDITLEENNVYQFINELGELTPYPKYTKNKNETDREFYLRRMEDRKKSKDLIYKKMEEDENRFYEATVGIQKKDTKKSLGDKKKVNKLAEGLRNKKKSLDNKIEKSNDEAVKEQLEKRKDLILEYADMIGTDKNFNEEDFNKIIEGLESTFNIDLDRDGNISTTNKNLIKQFKGIQDKYSYLNEVGDLRKVNSSKIRSTEIMLKIPDDNNLNIDGKIQQEYLQSFIKKVYPDNDILYMATHYDENPDNPHTHVKLSGFNKSTNDFDLMNTEIKYLAKYAENESAKKYFNDKKNIDIEYVNKEIENLQSKIDFAFEIDDEDNEIKQNTHELEKMIKKLKEEKEHLENYHSCEVPKNKDGTLKKWKDYSVAEQKNHGAMFQDILFRGLNTKIKKDLGYNPNFKKRTLEQKMIDDHDYENRTGNILTRLNNRQNKIKEEIKRDLEQAEIDKKNIIDSATQEATIKQKELEEKNDTAQKKYLENLSKNNKAEIKLEENSNEIESLKKDKFLLVKAKQEEVKKFNETIENNTFLTEEEKKKIKKDTKNKQDNFEKYAEKSIDNFDWEPQSIPNEKYNKANIVTKNLISKTRLETEKEIQERFKKTIMEKAIFADRQALEETIILKDEELKKAKSYLKKHKGNIVKNSANKQLTIDNKNLIRQRDSRVTVEDHQKVLNELEETKTKLEETKKENSSLNNTIDNLNSTVEVLQGYVAELGVYFIEMREALQDDFVSTMKDFRKNITENIVRTCRDCYQQFTTKHKQLDDIEKETKPDDGWIDLENTDNPENDDISISIRKSPKIR